MGDMENKFSQRLARFEKYYLWLVIFCGVAVGVGIFVAVMINVLLGIAICMLAAAAYIWFCADGAYKILGLRFKNTDGAVCVTRAISHDGFCAIPSRLIYADVRGIGDGALKGAKNAELCRIFIPKGIEKIGKDILPADTAPAVCFEGTREEWEKIESLTDFEVCELCFEYKLGKDTEETA